MTILSQKVKVSRSRVHIYQNYNFLLDKIKVREFQFCKRNHADTYTR